MSRKVAAKELMETLHAELAKSLMKRIKSGEATASDLNVVRQFLKDNGIDAVPKEGSPLGNLVNSLPDKFEDDDDGVSGFMN